MDSFPWEILLAVFGVVVPIVAALWEFVFFGLKRLGYRVQLDTTASDEVHPPGTEGWERLWPNLTDPSLVLLRIENNGITNIDSSDYQVLDHDRVGLRVKFPGRQVHRVVVTEPSDDSLLPNFGSDSGLSRQDSQIELPRVPLNRGQHYKVLALLDSATGEQSGRPYEKPKVIGGVKGGVRRGLVLKTKSRSSDFSWRTVVLICFLVLVVAGQFVVWLTAEDANPLDCADEGSSITVVGSTAFDPVLEAAATSYEETCLGTEISVETDGSLAGLERLNQEASGSVVAFSDGPKPNTYGMLVPRPIAFSLFTVVVNPEAGVADLPLSEIRRVYEGDVATWSELGGNTDADTPVVLVSRGSGSGTRQTFESRVLQGAPLQYNSNDCRTLLPNRQGDVLSCEVGDTTGMLTTVAETEGAIGYAELSAALAAERRGEVRVLRIDGQRASLAAADHDAYPFWETEYAYTYDEPEADSLTASFLRYLTNEVGKDIIRRHGHRPCAELQNPVLCQPLS